MINLDEKFCLQYTEIIMTLGKIIIDPSKILTFFIFHY